MRSGAQEPLRGGWRIGSGIVGVVLALFGSALALNVLSVRDMASELAGRHAFMLVSQAHAITRHDGAQVLEWALAILGLLLVSWSIRGARRRAFGSVRRGAVD
jgi:hypothetical protein